MSQKYSSLLKKKKRKFDKKLVRRGVIKNLMIEVPKSTQNLGVRDELKRKQDECGSGNVQNGQRK